MRDSAIERTFKPIELAIRRGFMRLLQTRKKQTSQPATPLALGNSPKIILLRQDRLGDAIVSTPLLVAIRDRFPKAEITMLLGSNNRAIASMLPVECSTAIYSKKLFKDLQMLRTLRRKQFDVAIDLTDNASATSSILISRIKPHYAIGIQKENDAVYDIVVPRLEPSRHHITERIAELLRPLGIDPKSISLKPELKLPEIARVKGRVGINISAGSESRYAPVETYAEIARTVVQLHSEGEPLTVSILSEPSDKEFALSIVAKANHSGVSLLEPANSYRAFAELLATCEYLITPDTSVVHLGAAIGIPMVVVYAPIPEGLMYWTPVGVPYEMMVQTPSLRTLEPGPVLVLFKKLLNRVSESPKNVQTSTQSGASQSRSGVASFNSTIH